MIKFLQTGNRTLDILVIVVLCLVVLIPVLLVTGVFSAMVAYLWPGYGHNGANSPGMVATIGDETIHADEITKLANNLLKPQRMPEQYRSAILPQVLQAASRQIFQEAEIRYEAKRRGMTVSDQELRDELRNGQIGAVLFPGGQWIGQKRYEDLLRENGTTVEAFEKQAKTQLLARKLLATVVASVDVSPSEVEKLFKEQNTKVKFDYAVLRAADLTKGIKPTETELKAYLEIHKASYQNSIPEKRQIRYFVVPDKDIQSKVVVTPDEVRKYYNEHQEQFRTAEQVRTRHILVKTPHPGPDGRVDPEAVNAARAKAQDLLKQIRAGADFAEVARKRSDDPGSAAKGGEIGFMPKGTLVPEYENVAYAQNVGQISDPVQSSFGFHIIQTEDKRAAGVATLAQVQGQIEAGLRSQKLSALSNQIVSDVQSTAKAQGLDKAATKFNASVLQSNGITANDPLPGIGASSELMGEAFHAPPDAGPQAVHVPQGTVVFEVTKIEPARTPSLNEIRDRVNADFMADRSKALLQQKLLALADRARTDQGLRKAAKEAGAKFETSELVGRTSSVPDIGAMSGPASVAFSLKPGEISSAIFTGAGGVVLAVTERQEPSTTDADFVAEEDRIRDQITNEKRGQAIQLFISNLETRMKKEGTMKINKGEMDKLVSHQN